MSYANVPPSYYQVFEPNAPWHAGSPGWSTAWVPGWGNNPNRAGPPRLGVQGTGQEPPPMPTAPRSGWPAIIGLGALLGLMVVTWRLSERRS